MSPNGPLSRTNQDQRIRVPTGIALKVTVPPISTSLIVVTDATRVGRSYSVSSMTIPASRPPQRTVDRNRVLFLTFLDNTAQCILGVTVAVLTSDVILGVIAGAGLIAIAVQMVSLWTGHSGPPVSHR